MRDFVSDRILLDRDDRHRQVRKSFRLHRFPKRPEILFPYLTYRSCHVQSTFCSSTKPFLRLKILIPRLFHHISSQISYWSIMEANVRYKVIEYLSKKGYNRTEAMLRVESASQDAEGRPIYSRVEESGGLKYRRALGKSWPVEFAFHARMS